MRRDVLIALLLALATLAVYSQVRSFEFVAYDDGGYVSENPHVREGLTLASAKWAFTTGRLANWHPLTWLSHMLDCTLYGLDAGLHHTTSLILHIGNVLLLFLVLNHMTHALGRSAVVAALFALHPLHVESVAWVAERKDVLSTLFWLLTMGAYARYVARRGAGRYALALGLFALGLMAKPMLVSLPFVLLLLDLWPLGRLSRAVVREKIPFFALSAASCVVTFLVQRSGGAVPTMDRLPLSLRLANASISYWGYVRKMLWPDPLAVFYPFAASWPPWAPACAWGALFGASAAALWARARRPFLTVGWFWYLGTLVPVIGLVQVGRQAMADRYTYIPLIGLFIALSWGAAEIVTALRIPRPLAASACAALLAALGLRAFVQVRTWRSTMDLFSHALTVTNDNALAHNILGNLLAGRGEIDQALVHFRDAVRIEPRYPSAQNSLGLALARQGKAAEAIAHFQQALESKPDYAKAHLNLAGVLEQLGKPIEAERHYAAAVRLDPEDAEAENNLGAFLADLGRLPEAIEHYGRALRLRPRFAEALNNWGSALARQGKAEAAMGRYEEALRVRPEYADAHYNLGLLLDDRGEVDEAIVHLREALRLSPGSASAAEALRKAALKKQRLGGPPRILVPAPG